MASPGEFTRVHRAVQAGLTRQELERLQACGEGSGGEDADPLLMSACAKLGARNTLHAVTLAIMAGLIGRDAIAPRAS